ncbi:hypothetical protein CLAFUW4_08061 [Fulvia fulva]|uniref:DUF8035 domain-containing protein n=1 Tax=Passalora fulva TaxID=5499 RepID=A0A9Q8LCQ4_PASFU|nr:uncharacterized protein CLAFUR5_08179 [Fulvia fulva]KAK4628773.1 hypothetical protein CLAFUR4_08066 [Fulvia fulva]KAK4629893.1 hypothetical protein CLAFUR0_08061 [Fulvia fulva]UJO15111.1 hypothetical protein CLAFUR5_08179 [Fulvia fulva]WPV12303.1 hypothetical protein CLAFUW4_08061 [Fulvia fulva]WPV27487.1 hypothetical protein CLAFUW7_08061 [Fulvia fulva]
MSRYRSSGDDLAYGEIPQRWDRERFERFSRGPPPPPARGYEEDIRFTERERPGRREIDIAIADREPSRGPRPWERERYFEEDRARSRPRRRTDRELFGDMDPREVAEMALTPYRPRDDFEHGRPPPRPGLVRRQSSLDTFDRKPARYEREEYRIPAYQPVPLPIRRSRDAWEEERYRDEPEDYREVEIHRERSVHRRRPPKSERSVKDEKKETHYHHSHHSDETSSSSSSSFTEIDEVKSVKSRAPSKAASKAPSKAPSKATSRAPTKVSSRRSRAPSVYESIHETEIEEDIIEAPPPPQSVHETSIHETAFEESVREERRFKKGKTRMPKRLVRREAIMDLGYPFDEEDDFFVLRIALEKEQIDEVIHISETYKDGEKKKVYHFEEKIEETTGVPPPPVGEHEHVERTEWINPPSIAYARSHRAKSVRESSPTMTSISRRSPPRSKSRGGTVYEERKTVIEETRSPPPPPPPGPPEFYEERKTVIEERAPSHNHGTLVLSEHSHRSDRDINGEIRALEAERRALRLEREAEERRDMALRLRAHPEEEYQLVEYRDRSRPREEMVVYERERSPPRNVIRVEKDRKGRMALVRSTH